MTQYPNFIAGNFTTTGKAIPIKSPFDDRVIGTMFEATQADVESAVAGAERAFETYRKEPSHKRAEILWKLAALLQAARAEFAGLITAESGKPIKFAEGEVTRCVQTIEIAAEEATRIEGETMSLDGVPTGAGKFAITKRFPIGPILGYSAFNFPLNLAAHKFAPALAVGNTIVMKTPPLAPASFLALARLFEEAGVPKGVVSILHCDVAAAEKMVRDDRFKMLSFTGSARVGWFLKGIAGRKKVILELGGNAGLIFHSDGNLGAVEKIATSAFANAGQVCISTQRIYVHRPVYAEFLARFLEITRTKMHAGDPSKTETIVGPVINDDAVARLENALAEARHRGAKIECGGSRNGRVFAPTVLTETKPDMTVECEEIFGPMVTITPYDDYADALTRVNRSRYGLQAGLFTRDLDRILQALDTLEVGGVMVNDTPMFRVDAMPYGGVKDSGFGREGLKYTIAEMTEIRLAVMNPAG